jgi:hypothetical protein
MTAPAFVDIFVCSMLPKRPSRHVGHTLTKATLINSVSSFPRRRESSQIKQLDTRVRGYDE